MICICLLQKSAIDKTKSTTACTDLFLHAYQLREITAGFLRTQFIAPLPDFSCSIFYSADAGDIAGYMKHVTHISFYACADCFFYLLIGYYHFFFWIIQLTFWCKGAFCKSYAFQFITAERCGFFHNRIADQVIITFFAEYNYIMRIEMKTIFLWKISEIINTHLATNGLACTKTFIQNFLRLFSGTEFFSCDSNP